VPKELRPKVLELSAAAEAVDHKPAAIAAAIAL
jgi:hypothetical protein